MKFNALTTEFSHGPAKKAKAKNPFAFLGFIIALMLFVLLLLQAACVETGTKKPGYARHLPQWGGEYEVSPLMEKNMPRSIAVLPFTDASKSQEGTDVVRAGFYNHFSSLSFLDMEFHNIDRILVMNGLADPEKALEADPKMLGEILKADAVIKGRVSNFDKLWAGVYSQVSVGARVEMYDTKTGELLWRGEHTVRYHEGGVPLSVIGIVSTIVSTSLNMRQIQLLRACDDLFRDMVKTIPVPEIGQARIPPQITMLVQDSQNQPKKAGQRIQIALQGEPRMTAWAEIGDYRTKIPLEEVEPGAYLGVYTVMPGDNVEKAVVTGYLSDISGNSSSWVDPVGRITLDTTAPNPPANLNATGRDQAVLLKWEANQEKDLAGYEIFMSGSPLSGFQQLGKTEFTTFEVRELDNFESRFFRVTALDNAGNEGLPSTTVKGMAVAPGPVSVKGVVEADTTWYAGAGPYVLEGPVIVAEDALLNIEPGTKVIAANGGITVRGRLYAIGRPDSIISFSGKDGAVWPGIVFSGTGEKQSSLSSCLITNAQVAITAQSASPSITECEITENGLGISISGMFSRPSIVGCTIARNAGGGISVTQNALPDISSSIIQNNSGPGLCVDTGASRITGNTIRGNNGGASVLSGEVVLEGNNFLDNHLFDVSGPAQGTPVTASDNYWATELTAQLVNRIQGRVLLLSVLDAPLPNGKSKPLFALSSTLPAAVEKDAILLAAYSPFMVSGVLKVQNGATLTIQAGVTFQYDTGASIMVEDGAVVARGKEDAPILFTSSGSSHAPGDYGDAIHFAGQTTLGSFFEYCEVAYATAGFNVAAGAPEITRCLVRHCSQSGIRATNDAAPKVLYSTITKNQGSGGLECLARSNPKIHYCNITDNIVAIQALSTIHIDARNNWWGMILPDESIIWGTNINFDPWLEAPSQQAWQGSIEK